MGRFKELDHKQSQFIILDFEEQLMEGTFEYVLYFIFERGLVNIEPFIKKYLNDKNGRKAYHPSIMLKIIMLGYSRGVISSRKLARLCKENILFKVISCSSEPDFTTIADFVSGMHDEILSVFKDVLKVCDEFDLIGGEVFALDGHKVSSNASKEWSGTFNDLKKREEKCLALAKNILEDHVKADKGEYKKNLKERADKYIKKVNKINEFLNSNSPKIGASKTEIQSNITDNESARMMSSHGVIQGYTGEAMVDEKSQIIIYAEAFGVANENNLVQEMVKQSNFTLESIKSRRGNLKGKILLADNGNSSKDNLEFLDKLKIDAYIPDHEFRKRDKNFQSETFKKHKSKTPLYYPNEKFIYNKANDTYICPNGKLLQKQRIDRSKTLEGYRYAAKEKDCSVCPLRETCLRKKNTKYRTIKVNIIKIGESTLYDKMKEKIDSTEGKKMYSKRMGIVEPVFANIRAQKKLNYFTLRSKKKVNIQWNLFSIIHNLEKLRSVFI